MAVFPDQADNLVTSVRIRNRVNLAGSIGRYQEEIVDLNPYPLSGDLLVKNDDQGSLLYGFMLEKCNRHLQVHDHPGD